MKQNQIVAVLTVGFLIGPLTAQAQYNYQQIDYPGQARSQVFGINDSGDAVANGFDPDDIPFVYAAMDGAITDVAPAEGYASTSLLGINDAGVMAGSVDSLDGATRSGFTRSPKGEYTIFAHPDAASSTNARGINNKGLVSGFRDSTTNPFIGFIYDSNKETFTDIDTGPTRQTIAHGINSKGEVVGNARFTPENDPCGSGAAGPVTYGWLRKTDGSVLFFQINGQYTGARGINDAGFIVGQTEDPNTFVRKGFIAKKPKTSCVSISVPASELLQFPGSLYTYPEGVTNSGTVVGVFFDDLNNTHGFIATED